MTDRRTPLSLVVLAACSSAPPPAPPTPTPHPRPAPDAAVPAPPKKVTYPGAPQGPAGDQLAWALDALANRKGELEPAEIEAHFDAAFLAKVPAPQLAALLHRIAGMWGAIKIDDVQDEAGGLRVRATAANGAKLVISVAADADGKIARLLLAPDELHFASWDEAKAAIAAVAPHAQALVARVDKGACTPVHELAAGDELAIGSTFKLYVLLALADSKPKWDSEIAVRDDWKSLPSGVTQNDAAGTKLTVRTLAERMISISDNTATDHLLYTVGRKNVEAALTTAKHSKPALNVPFLSTRELFLLKLEPTAIDEYLKLKPDRRRDALDKGLAGQVPTLEHVGEWTTARRIDKLEWFASSTDLCRAMATLSQRGQDVLDVLAKNPGPRIDTKTFPYVGFKGGSEPGVVSTTWLLKRDDDKWFVVSLTFNADEGGTVDENKAIPIAGGVVELAGKER